MAKEGGYALLDCGEGERLERFGPVTVARPAPAATWPRGLDAAWAAATLAWVREGRGGRWIERAPLPTPWIVDLDPVKLYLHPLAHGRLGVFPEQIPNWRWLRENVDAAAGPLRVLNLFAYTGAATLACSRPQTEVVHLDAAKPAVSRARENAAPSGCDRNPIRWLVDDALTFMRREARRGRRYEGMILDPPAFGRGKGKTWKLERDLDELLALAARLLADRPRFLLLSCHHPRYTAADLAAGLRRLPGNPRLEPLPLTVAAAGAGRDLPLGVCCRASWPVSKK